MADGLDKDSEFFETWLDIGPTVEGTPANKFWAAGSFLALVEIGGMDEWAQLGGAATVETLGYLREAGLHELATVLEHWMAALPGGVSDLDLSFQESLFWKSRLSNEERPELDPHNARISEMVEQEGNAYGAQLLDWYRRQLSIPGPPVR